MSHAKTPHLFTFEGVPSAVHTHEWGDGKTWFVLTELAAAGGYATANALARPALDLPPHCYRLYPETATKHMVTAEGFKRLVRTSVYTRAKALAAWLEAEFPGTVDTPADAFEPHVQEALEECRKAFRLLDQIKGLRSQMDEALFFLDNTITGIEAALTPPEELGA